MGGLPDADPLARVAASGAVFGDDARIASARVAPAHFDRSGAHVVNLRSPRMRRSSQGPCRPASRLGWIAYVHRASTNPHRNAATHSSAVGRASGVALRHRATSATTPAPHRVPSSAAGTLHARRAITSSTGGTAKGMEPAIS